MSPVSTLPPHHRTAVCLCAYVCGVCVCACWETYPTCEPTPNLTAAVPGSAVLAEHSYYTLNIHNSFIWSNLVRKKSVAFGNVSTVLCLRICWNFMSSFFCPYCIYVWVLRGEALVIIISQGTVSKIKTKMACSGRGGRAAGCAVFLQQGHAAEGARTGAALIFLHICVGLQVRAQVRTSAKARLQCGQENGRSPVGEKRERVKTTVKCMRFVSQMFFLNEISLLKTQC